MKVTGNIPAIDNFWRTLETPLISFEIDLILTWSKYYVISSTTGKIKFAVTCTKLHVPIVTLSSRDSAKLTEQLKCCFKRLISWNKYQSKVPTERQNHYLDFSIDLRL